MYMAVVGSLTSPLLQDDFSPHRNMQLRQNSAVSVSTAVLRDM